MRPAQATRRTVFALSGLSGSDDLLPTVGSGIRPDLLTLRLAAKALADSFGIMFMPDLPPVGTRTPP